MQAPPASTSPIFTDGSGRRAAVVQWTARAFCLGCALVAGAVVFTLTTHVPLPGLDRILPPRTESDAGRTTIGGTGTGVTPGTLVAGLPAGSTGRLVSNETAAPRSESAAVAVAPPPARERAAQVADIAVQPVPTRSAAPAPAPAAAPDATSQPTPHPQAQGARTSNPHAEARQANSSVRATPRTTKTANPTAEAARTMPKPSARPTATPADTQK